MTAQANILVISDLHLGEDLKPTSKIGYLRHIVMLERELESFLDHYAAQREGGRPWRLVINGDMVDFLAVCLMDAPRADTLEPALDDDEREEIEDVARFGVGSDAEGARAKMVAVGRRHPGVFQRLARFLAAGNQVVIIMGNHDVEFHWPEVQDALRGIVQSCAPADDPGARATIADNLSFSPWFYYEEDLVWIEHGHQYDDYCSFDYWLNPVAPPQRPHQRPGIVMSLGGAGMRYFSNLMPDMNTYNQEDWSGLDYLRWGFRKGVRGVLRVIWLYFFLFYQLARGCRFLTRTAIREARRVVHLRRLGELAKKTRLSEKTLLAIDSMRRTPVMMNVLKLMQTLMLDRVVILVLTPIMAISCFAFLSWPVNAGAAGGLVLLAGLAGWLTARGRNIDAGARLRAMSRMILRHVSARFVIMGHTHEPAAVSLGGGAYYFNTGTWVAIEKPGVDRSFTHVKIEHQAGGPRATLCRWSSVARASHEFDPRPRAPARMVLSHDEPAPTEAA